MAEERRGSGSRRPLRRRSNGFTSSTAWPSMARVRERNREERVREIEKESEQEEGTGFPFSCAWR